MDLGALLPIEEHDVTATELHLVVMFRLYGALSIAFAGTALVLSDIFVRIEEKEQAAPDVLVIRGATQGARSVYRIPDEPVPDVTIEVLSPINDQRIGRTKLQRKRSLFGRIGVPVHLEIDPQRGYITRWTNVDGELVGGPPTDRYDGPDLAGVRLALTPGQVHVYLPDGREYLDPAAEALRATAERERAESERQRAESERQRADRLAQALRNAGIDPDSV